MTRALLALLLAAAPLFAQDKAVKDLEGTYAVKEFERAGKAVPEATKDGITSVGISGGKLTVKAGGKEIVATLKADASKKPAELDLFPQGMDYEKGRRFLGLYKVDGDELTIVFVEDGERPKDFDPKAPSATKLVLKKR